MGKIVFDERNIPKMQITVSNRASTLKPSAIREIFKSLTDPSVISFAAGNPSPESFPVADMQRFANDIFENEANTALQYSITEGYIPLRSAILERQKRKFNIGKEHDTVLVMTGGQQGIEHTCKMLCNEGDTVICEEPTFIGALNAFRSYGCRLAGVPMDDDGINIEKLEQACKDNPNAKIIYLIPTFQNPTGKTMSLEKRIACLEIAKKYGLFILEDNPYGELRFSGNDVPTIKSMDTEGRVIYCSSFSKILSAGMRVGFLLLHEEIAGKIAILKQISDVHTNIFFQMMCHKFLTEYDLDAHIEKIKRLYGRKAGLMLKCLDESMPEGFTYTRPDGGLFIWGDMPKTVDPKAFIRELTENKLAVVPGATFMCDGDAVCHGFRMNYSTPSDEQIIKGVDILATVAKRNLK